MQQGLINGNGQALRDLVPQRPLSLRVGLSVLRNPRPQDPSASPTFSTLLHPFPEPATGTASAVSASIAVVHVQRAWSTRVPCHQRGQSIIVVVIGISHSAAHSIKRRIIVTGETAQVSRFHSHSSRGRSTCSSHRASSSVLLLLLPTTGGRTSSTKEEERLRQSGLLSGQTTKESLLSVDQVVGGHRKIVEEEREGERWKIQQ